MDRKVLIVWVKIQNAKFELEIDAARVSNIILTQVSTLIQERLVSRLLWDFEEKEDILVLAVRTLVQNLI